MIKKLTDYLFTTLFLFTLSTQISFGYVPPPQNEQDFQNWLVEFKQQAHQQGISQATLDKAFANVHLNKRVLELDRRQPEFARTFWQYFNSAVTDWRIKKGQYLLKKYQPKLSKVTQKYGVPERILIAFWGIETNYGDYTGNTSIIESLATLSYDKRRSEFFQKELIAALKILDQGNIPLSKMKGSWAGAMGQPQFMPSNYLAYAVDADNSGKKDLWGSMDDVFHSMGNFLKILGWKKGENWGREVRLPENFDLGLADGKTMRPLSEWKKMGLKHADGRALPDADLDAALLLPYDYRGPAFLVFNNFFVIKKWNRSNSYALAVGHLADRLVGRATLSKKQPRDDQALSRQEMTEMQERLKLEGLNVGALDGVAGSKTREAIRQYQINKKLPVDGYPSYRMLKILRNNQDG